jgi:hypothetical protein
VDLLRSAAHLPARERAQILENHAFPRFATLKPAIRAVASRRSLFSLQRSRGTRVAPNQRHTLYAQLLSLVLGTDARPAGLRHKVEQPEAEAESVEIASKLEDSIDGLKTSAQGRRRWAAIGGDPSAHPRGRPHVGQA